MATNIFAQLGFSFNKSSVTNVVQATTTIKDSIINLGPVFNDFQKKIDAASDVTKWVGLSTAFSGVFSGIKSSVTSVIGDVKKIYGFVDDYAQKGDKISKTSRLLGLSVKDYQAFSSAALDSGMSIEEMDESLKKFTVNLAKAKSGNKKSFKPFDAILGGKSLSDFGSSRELIIAMADGYSRLESAEQKALVSNEIFGKSGLKMSEMLSQGGESLKSFLDAYDKGFSQDGAENAERFTHEFQKMHEEFEQIKMSVAMDLFPVFKDLFITVSDMMRSNNGEDLKKQFSDLGKSIGTFVVDVIPRIPKILESIVKILDLITPEGVLITLSIVKIIPMLTTIFGFAKAIGVVLSGSVLGAVGLVVAAIVLWGSVVLKVRDNWDMLKSFIVDDVWGAVKQFFSDCIDAVKNWVNMFIADVQWLWNGFKSIFIDPIFNFLDALPQAFNDLWEGFKTGALAAINTVKDLLKSLPVIGGFFNDGSNGGNSNTSSGPVVSAASAAASVIQQSSVTTTNRFAVDFGNVPQGTMITPPSSGDFDWSRSYTLAGAV